MICRRQVVAAQVPAVVDDTAAGLDLSVQPSPSDRLWESAEVLQYLGIARATLDRYVRSGQIPTCQFSPRGRRFFRKSDIDAALSPQTAAVEPAADVDFIRNRIRKGAP